MLTKQPDLVYLKFEGATWTVHKDLGRGIYPLKATGKIWTVNEKTSIKARRKGFQIVPDFGQTAHSMQGASLEAVIVDCLQADHVCKMTDMLTSYIGLSRVKSKEALLISEPFSPVLFCQGKAIGPETVMKVLHRKITIEDAEQEHRCSPLSPCLGHYVALSLSFARRPCYIQILRLCICSCMCCVCKKHTTITGDARAQQEAAR